LVYICKLSLHLYQKVKKKIGSNLVLQEREIRIIPQKPWEILWELPSFATAKEALSAKKTIWLGVPNEIRTFFEENPNAEF